MSLRFALVDFSPHGYGINVYPIVEDHNVKGDGSVLDVYVSDRTGRNKTAVLNKEDIFDSLDEALKELEVRFIKIGQHIVNRHNNEVDLMVKHIANYQKRLLKVKTQTLEVDVATKIKDLKDKVKSKVIYHTILGNSSSESWNFSLPSIGAAGSSSAVPASNFDPGPIPLAETEEEDPS